MRCACRRATATGSPPAKTQMTGIEQQPDVVARFRHQAIDLGLGLHDRAHVMMEREAHAARAQVLRDLVEPRAERRPVARPRAPADATAARRGRRRCCRGLRRRPSRCSPSRRAGARCASTAAVSSATVRRHSCALYQPETRRRPWRSRIGRSVAASRGNLPPISMPAKPAESRFREAHLERNVAAQLRHVVVGPGDRVDAERDVHGRSGSRPTAASSPRSWSGDRKWMPWMPRRVAAAALRGDVVDEHRRFRRDPVALDRIAKDARIGLHDAARRRRPR